METKVNLAEKLALLDAPFQPGIVGTLNDYKLAVVKVHGEFVWSYQQQIVRAQVWNCARLAMRRAFTHGWNREQGLIASRDVSCVDWIARRDPTRFRLVHASRVDAKRHPEHAG